MSLVRIVAALQGKTHVRICFEVLRMLRVPSSTPEASRLREGVLDPDRNRREYSRHHWGKSKEIEINLTYARRCFLQDNFLDAYYYLGTALHYIQDAYTSVVSYDSPKNYIWHQNWEQDIEDSHFLPDVESAIKYSFRDNHSKMRRYSDLAQYLSRTVDGRDATLRTATMVGHERSRESGKPIIDLNLALLASYVISKSILSPKNCLELEATLSKTKKDYETLLQDSEFLVSAELAGLVRKRDALKSKIVPEPGIVRKMKNLLCNVRIAIKNQQMNHKFREYTSQSHLRRIARRYDDAVSKITFSYEGWYNFRVSNIDFSVIEKDISTIAEASSNLSLTTDTIRTLLGQCGYSCLVVGNMEMIRMSELNDALRRTPKEKSQYFG
jgi:hypothetical protein